MNNIVTNAILFNDFRGNYKMFAEVVEDDRHPKGHHIVTSNVLSVDEELGIVITENTKYNVERFLTKEQFIDYVDSNFELATAQYYKECTNLR